ncbi:hypothetical protein McaMca56_004820 [Microsporum canis]
MPLQHFIGRSGQYGDTGTQEGAGDGVPRKLGESWTWNSLRNWRTSAVPNYTKSLYYINVVKSYVEMFLKLGNGVIFSQAAIERIRSLTRHKRVG